MAHGGPRAGVQDRVSRGEPAAPSRLRSAHAGGASGRGGGVRGLRHPFGERDIPLQDALALAARRYRACPRFARHYVASKLRRDPVHRDVLVMAAREPFGDVVDLGCGRGQLGVALLAAGLARSVLGVDRAGPALADACRAAAGLPFAVRDADLAADPGVSACDTVLLVDVLYQLGAGPALVLLRAAARAARERVVVRTLDPGQGWRSRLAYALEWGGRGWWPHAGQEVEPLAVPVLLAVLHEEGFAASAAPCWRGTPFANVLIAARRQA